MQYLLTEEEYKNLSSVASLAKKMISESELQKLCTFAADNIPIETFWSAEKEPWGCILSDEGEHYCDDCPVQEWCQYPSKEWSK